MTGVSHVEKVDVVCFSDIFWDFVWQRHQSLLTRFPVEWQILFIEPTSLVVLLKEPRRLFSRKIGNITVVSLPALPLTDRVSFLRPINDYFILGWLRLMFILKGIRRPVLLYYAPRFSSLIGRLEERLVAYDCADDRMAFSRVPPWMKPYVEGLLKKSDVVFVTSENLKAKALACRGDNVYLVGNGVDAELFQRDMPIPDDIKGLKKPVIGYFGVIDEWMDVDLVAETAAAYPDASIALIGPVLIGPGELQKLKNKPNVALLGQRSHEVLPGYLKAFDACIIPFKLNELTRSVNPVKLYEYLAGGKNVVTTAMPELEQYGNVAFIARDGEDFIKKIRIALSSRPDADRIRPIIDDNTWDRKAKNMVGMLENIMGAR